MTLRILVCGPEASGTKMMTTFFAQAAQGLDVEVTHRSFPYGGGPRPRVVNWPETTPADFDVAIIVTRDWFARQEAQRNTGHAADVYLSQWTREAYERIFTLAAGKRFYVLPYESVILHPECLRPIFVELGLRPYVPDVEDTNAKYYGGAEFHDNRTVEIRLQEAV